MFTVKTYRMIIGDVIDGMAKEIAQNGLAMELPQFAELCNRIAETAYLHQALKQLEAEESSGNWQSVGKQAERVYIGRNDNYSVYCEILYTIRNMLIRLAKTKTENHKS